MKQSPRQRYLAAMQRRVASNEAKARLAMEAGRMDLYKVFTARARWLDDLIFDWLRE